MRILKSFILLACFLGVAYSSFAKPHKGAELYSKEAVLYGKFEFRMRAAKGSGILSTFFLYKNGSEVAGTYWEEIDIEVFGKDDAVTFQSNIITDGLNNQPKIMSEQNHTQTTSLADAYHTYALEWTPEYVAWFIDGTEVRRTTGGQVANLTNAMTMRFNLWASTSVPWVGAFDDSVLPVHQYINWLKYSSYANGTFTHEWTDDFTTFNEARWARANWTFDGNYVDFVPENLTNNSGMLVLSFTSETATGYSGTAPDDVVSGIKTGGKKNIPFLLKPNPVSDHQFHLDLSSHKKICEISIYDSQGLVVFSKKEEAKFDVLLELPQSLKKGMYLLVVKSPKGQSSDNFVLH